MSRRSPENAAPCQWQDTLRSRGLSPSPIGLSRVASRPCLKGSKPTPWPWPGYGYLQYPISGTRNDHLWAVHRVLYLSTITHTPSRPSWSCLKNRTCPSPPIKPSQKIITPLGDNSGHCPVICSVTDRGIHERVYISKHIRWGTFLAIVVLCCHFSTTTQFVARKFSATCMSRRFRTYHEAH